MRNVGVATAKLVRGSDNVVGAARTLDEDAGDHAQYRCANRPLA